MKTTLLLLVITLITLNATCQEVNFNNLEKGRFDTYISSSVERISKGDTITFGMPSTDKGFRYLSQGGLPVHPTRTGAKGIVSKIKILKNGITLQPWLYVKGFGLAPVTIPIEEALKSGELEL